MNCRISTTPSKTVSALLLLTLAASPAFAGSAASKLQAGAGETTLGVKRAVDERASGTHGDDEQETAAAKQSRDKEQTPRDGQPRADRRDRASDTVAHVPELRDETFRLMDAYVISNLQESLGLTDDQFAKALPLVKRLQSDRRDLAKRRLQALRLLRKSLASGAATEAGVADLLKSFKAASAEERAGAIRNLEALDSVLTPLQQAKYRVFEAEVDLRLRHLLAKSQDRDRREPR